MQASSCNVFVGGVPPFNAFGWRRPAFQRVWLPAFRLHAFQCVSDSHAGFNLCVLAAPAFCVKSLACLWGEYSCAVVLCMSLSGSSRARAQAYSYSIAHLSGVHVVF